MINLSIVFTLIFSHWIFDFIMQSDEEAKGKSSSNYWLLSHTFKYSILWFPIIMVLMCPYEAVIFVLVIFIAHTITDYFTSRLNTKLYNKGDIHNFFVSVGFDQVLHYVQLLLTYYYLTK